MQRLTTRAAALIGAAIIAAAPARAADAPKPATPALQPGFMPLAFDGAKGRVLIEVPAFDSDVLYYVSAAARSSCRSTAACSTAP